MPGGELVDVVDAADRVVGVATRAEMRARNLRHRCASIVVRDTAGRLLVHRRAEDKDVWPGRWDLAAGGVVASGEDYDAAAERELAEEIGITGCPLTVLGRGTYADESVDALYQVYEVVWDGPVSFDDGEVVEARWITVDDLGPMIEQETFVPDSLAVVRPLCR